jgi:Terpene synthase family 2, C-terminal metal binding
MFDRRITKLKDTLLRLTDETKIIQHLEEDERRGWRLAEACALSLVLHPSASFDQALALVRTIAYAQYIDDYIEEEHPELDMVDYRRVGQLFLIWHNRDLSQMPVAHANVARKMEEQFAEDEVSEEWTPMRRLVWEKFIFTLLQENHWVKHQEQVTLDAYLANGLYTIALPIVQVSILAFAYQDVPQELKNRLFGHICQASRVVRIANDLHSYEHEHAHGRFNSLDLAAGALNGASQDNPRKDARLVMERELELLERGVARERRTGPTQDFLRRLVSSTHAAIDFYDSLATHGSGSALRDQTWMLQEKAG